MRALILLLLSGCAPDNVGSMALATEVVDSLVVTDVIFRAEDGGTGFVVACHYPDEFLMSTGGFLAKSGVRGFRAADPMGQSGIVVGTAQDYAYVSSFPQHTGGPRDLWLYASGKLRFTTEESHGFVEVELNGRPVRIPFEEVNP